MHCVCHSRFSVRSLNRPRPLTVVTHPCLFCYRGDCCGAFVAADVLGHLVCKCVANGKMWLCLKKRVNLFRVAVAARCGANTGCGCRTAGRKPPPRLLRVGFSMWLPMWLPRSLTDIPPPALRLSALASLSTSISTASFTASILQWV